MPVDQRDGGDTRSPSRVRQALVGFDSRPGVIRAVRRLRRSLPGDDQFGDPLSTAGVRPVEVVARGVTALGAERESALQELGMAGLQVWQSLSEATGRGRGDQPLALLFTDLAGFSSWALTAGDAAALELLREVGRVVEGAVQGHEGRIVKRLGDGLMASFLDAQQAVEAALSAQDGIATIEVSGYQPKMRAGVHWGRPRRLGGDYLGVDVNVAARVGDAARAGEVLVSDIALAQLNADGYEVSRAKRLRAEGAPRDLHVSRISRAE